MIDKNQVDVSAFDYACAISFAIKQVSCCLAPTNERTLGMKILDILAKLGILRVGAKKATWTSAKDMPAEFLMDDVVNAKRDLTTKEDIEKAKQVLAGKKTD